MTKQKVGTAMCWNPDCGEPVVVKKSESTGVLGYSCQHCEFSPYVRVGTPAYQALERSIAPDKDKLKDEPKPLPVPAIDVIDLPNVQHIVPIENKTPWLLS